MKTSLRLSRIALFFLFLMSSFSAFSQLAGMYTIDPSQAASATNYLNFTDAVNDLNTQGISSSVSFVVSPGIYNESVVINQITGSSSMNTIQFYSTTGNPADVYLNRISSDPNTETVLLNGTDYILFKAITFQTDNTTENTLLCLQNNSDDVSFGNCVFSAPFHDLALTTVDYDSYALFCIDQATIGTNQNPDNLNIDKCSFIGGGLALYINPYTIGGATMNNFKFVNSDIQQTSNICLYANGLNDAEIAKNTFNTQKTHNGEVQGIYLSNNCATTTNSLVYENDLFIGNQTGDVIAINVNNANSNGPYTIVKNNTVLATGNDNIVGLQTSDNDSLRIAHNTIRLLGGVSGAAYYEYSSVAASNSLYIENNIFVSNGNPYAFICNTNGGIGTPAIKISNFNDLYSSGGGYLQWDGVNYSTLSALQIAQALYNQNSVDVVPIFMSFFDHHLTDPSTKNPSLNGTAYSLYVSVDIDAETRSVTTPKMGADEFTLDIELMDLVNLSAFTCDTNSQFFLEALIENVASEDIEVGDTIIVAIEFDGNPPIYDTIIMSTVFSQGDNFIHTFSQAVDVSSSGTYDFLVYVSLLFDMNRLNDTIQQSMEVGPSFLVSLPPGIYCKGETVNFGGSILSVSGVYYDSLLTVLGCDSVIEFNITFNDTFRIINSIDICQGDSLFLGGAWQNTAGTYIDSFITVLGCDSLIQTNLTIIPSSYTVLLDIDICENDSILIFGSQWVSTTGIYYDTLSNAFGCDSILEQNIFLNPIVRDTLVDITICDNDSVFFAGNWQNTMGLFTDTLISSMSCDSIVFQQIYVNPSYFNTVNMSLCDGDSIMINSTWINTSGIYYDSLLTIQGCDSITELTLTVLSTFLNTTYIDICAGDSALVHGIWEYVSGTYDDSLTAVFGCDSIERVILTVNPNSYTVLAPISYCANDSILILGTWIAIAGTYYDTLLNITGCDSIIEISVTENPIYQDTLVDITICDNDSVLFGGSWYGTTGLYTDTLVSSMNCDSIVYQQINVNPSYLNSLSISICDGDSVLINGAWTYVSGLYYDSLLTVQGCDSITELTLTVLSALLNTTYIDICAGDSAFVHGIWQYVSGTYDDSLIAVFGCDSIERVILTVNPNSYTVLAPTSYCANDSIMIFGTWIGTAGTYYDTLLNHTACDSIIEISVTENPIYQDTSYATICANDSVLFIGNYYNISGVYSDSLISISGCDSIQYLDLTVYPIYVVNINQQICLGDSFLFSGSWLSASGIYYDSLISTSGCDSIIILNLASVPNIFYTNTQNICNGDSAYFAGLWLNIAGTYTDTVFSLTSCDTIYEFILNVGYPDTTDLNISLCYNDSLFFNSQYLNTAGTYYDTLTNVSLCDSLVILTLNYYSNSLPYAVLNQTICVGDSFLLGTNWVQLAGTYIDTSLTANLCDSVTELRLDVAIPSFISISQTICANDSIFFGGQYINSQGYFYDTLVNAAGCDSIVELILQFLPDYFTQFTQYICEGDSFDFNGSQLYIPGIYLDTFSSVTSCDSIVQLTLLFENIDLGPDTAICYGSCVVLNPSGAVSGYLWDDSSSLPNLLACPSSSRFYSVTATTSLGCQASDTIFIEVYPQPTAIIEAPDTAYAGDLVLFYSNSIIVGDSIVQYTWEFPGGIMLNGQQQSFTFDNPGVYVVVLYVYSSNSCMDSTLHTIVIIETPQEIPQTVNLITPNSDGVNEVFIIYNIESYEDNELWIYNRWGEIVYHVNNYENNWNAIYQGNNLPEATYYWLLEDGEGNSYTGAISVIR